MCTGVVPPAVKASPPPPRPKLKLTCAFCDATEGLAVCSRPGLTFQVARYKELVPGDRVRRYVDVDGRKPVATVVSTEPTPSGYRLKTEITWRLKGGSVKSRILIAAPSSRVRVERPGTCGRLACELHRCERADNVFYCQEHWGLEALETSAPVPLVDPLRSRTAALMERELA